MNSLLAASHQSIFIEVGLALAAFFVGACVSYVCFKVAGAGGETKTEREKPALPESQANDDERSRMAAQQLRDLAQNVATDVSTHNALVGDISTELGLLQSGGDSVANEAAVASAVARLLSANNKLQDRLEDAERKIQAQAEEIRTQQSEARTDSLTKLANRRAFDDELERCQVQALEANRPFSVIMLDVDHFKQFNDTHGHQAGDEVLRCVGRTLTKTVKAGDTPCRYGGEEFAVILANTKITDAVVAGERIRKAIESMPVSYDGKSLRVTASIGVAEVRESETGVSLVRRSDEAVYASKKLGRNCTHLHDGTGTVPAATAVKKPPTPAQVVEDVKSIVPPKVHGAEKLCDYDSFISELRRRIAESHRFGSPLSVIYFSVSDFPLLENTYGTAVGSLLVDSVSTFVQSTLRDMDLLAKVDRSELAILLPGSTVSAAKIVGQRIRTSISHCPIPLGSTSVRLSLDMGVATVHPEDDALSLLKHAKGSLEKTQGGESATETAAVPAKA